MPPTSADDRLARLQARQVARGGPTPTNTDPTTTDRLAQLQNRQAARGGAVPAGGAALPGPAAAAPVAGGGRSSRSSLSVGRVATVVASVATCLALVPMMGPITHNMSRPGHPVDEHGSPLPVAEPQPEPETPMEQMAESDPRPSTSDDEVMAAGETGTGDGTELRSAPSTTLPPSTTPTPPADQSAAVPMVPTTMPSGAEAGAPSGG